MKNVPLPLPCCEYSGKSAFLAPDHPELRDRPRPGVLKAWRLQNLRNLRFGRIRLSAVEMLNLSLDIFGRLSAFLISSDFLFVTKFKFQRGKQPIRCDFPLAPSGTKRMNLLH